MEHARPGEAPVDGTIPDGGARPSREAATPGGARLLPSSGGASPAHEADQTGGTKPSREAARPETNLDTPSPSGAHPPQETKNLKHHISRSEQILGGNTLVAGLGSQKTKNSEIAHDLNNAFTGIIGNLSLLKDDRALPAEVRKRLTLIEKAAQKAFELTQQLIKSTTNAARD